AGKIGKGSGGRRLRWSFGLEIDFQAPPPLTSFDRAAERIVVFEPHQELARSFIGHFAAQAAACTRAKARAEFVLRLFPWRRLWSCFGGPLGASPTTSQLCSSRQSRTHLLSSISLPQKATHWCCPRAPSPPANGAEHLGLCVNELRLLLGLEFDHGLACVRVSEEWRISCRRHGNPDARS